MRRNKRRLLSVCCRSRRRRLLEQPATLFRHYRDDGVPHFRPTCPTLRRHREYLAHCRVHTDSNGNVFSKMAKLVLRIRFRAIRLSQHRERLAAKFTRRRARPRSVGSCHVSSHIGLLSRRESIAWIYLAPRRYRSTDLLSLQSPFIRPLPITSERRDAIDSDTLAPY